MHGYFISHDKNSNCKLKLYSGRLPKGVIRTICLEELVSSLGKCASMLFTLVLITKQLSELSLALMACGVAREH